MTALTFVQSFWVYAFISSAVETGWTTIGVTYVLSVCVLPSILERLPEAACSVAQHLGGVKVELAVIMVSGGGVPVWLWYDDTIGQNSQGVLDDWHLQSIAWWQVPEYTCTHTRTHRKKQTLRNYFSLHYFFVGGYGSAADPAFQFKVLCLSILHCLCCNFAQFSTYYKEF